MMNFNHAVYTLIVASLCICYENPPMSKEERLQLREEAKDMFYHAYQAYMDNAYPADELMPLSCSGRYRGKGIGRGDIDDALGNFSLTLIDTLDSLVILGDLEEFERAVKLVIKDVTFDSDIVVSVFETNIRVLGGLLSAHILAEYVQEKVGVMSWYKGELLNMAKDLGYRLLPAFNSSTGIPYARVNLKYGIRHEKLEGSRETCTACAGTIILEMAALSRLTGEPVFEQKAHRAMDELWNMRHRSSDLMGTVLNVHSGDWIRRDSGVGAGIDSYYEYLLKAYILLGDEKYLGRFNRHYSAVMKYISQGPLLLDVHMHRPHTNSRNYMDALLAFWPGLQVLKGDIKPAVETHEMLYQVMQRHNFIPEAFTVDFQVHWSQHPLRPEFLESTYFLYRATNDPYYLEVGKTVLRSLQKFARVPCGFAAVNDVRTGKHEDRMDSFVLAETFKYLYILFAEPEELIINLNEFLFTTEAHLLPLTLANHSNSSSMETLDDFDVTEAEYSRTCPSTHHLLPETVRRPLHNMVNGMCPRRVTQRKITAQEFQVNNINHLKIIQDMGINLVALSDGRVQLLHSFANARTANDAEEGLVFMQEMVELSKSQLQPEAVPQAVMFASQDPDTGKRLKTVLRAGPSHFGRELFGRDSVSSTLALATPLQLCTDPENPSELSGRIAVAERGDCMFVDKARRAQAAGAVAAIVFDNVAGSSAANSPMFAMSGDGTDDIKIPVVFLFSEDADRLMDAFKADPSLEVAIAELKFFADDEEASVFQKIKVSLHELLAKHTKKEVAFFRHGQFKVRIYPDRVKVNFFVGGEADRSVNQPAKELDELVLHSWKRLSYLLLMKVIKAGLVVPLDELDVYYGTMTGDREPQKKDVAVKVLWFVRELGTVLPDLDHRTGTPREAPSAGLKVPSTELEITELMTKAWVARKGDVGEEESDSKERTANNNRSAFSDDEIVTQRTHSSDEL